ncbi:MAG: Phenylacetate-coenzyme A ligase [Deltaproteobacteria bacterium]|jgi:phenylacetate-CoA ligase|nr:Phenylacetate-coenzyme A ligase [Deltaproteobacteria bacterium]
MEQWSFPTKYDPNYLPESDSRYWFTIRETISPEQRNQAIVQRLREVMAYAYENASFYRNKWDEAGVHPDKIRSLEDFERVPVVAKEELRESQERAAPFGDYLCIPDSEVHRIHGTSGTTGRPTAFAIGRDDWQVIANNHARFLWGMGLRPGDTIFIASVFSLYMGSWGTLLGAERLGAKSFPFGAGAPGMTARAALWLNMTKPTAFYGTPSYALHLAETALDEGLNPRDFRLKVMFFSGEPGASIPGIRRRIEEYYDAKVIDSGSMAEMTPWMSVCGSAETQGLLLWQDVIYHEICDPKTFCRVPYGQRGTPVYTHLERTSQPMIRLASGDLTHWVLEDNPCGRTYPRLPDGIYGRIDDMFQVRGENIYPSEIDAVLNTLPDYGGEHRIVITREGAMDELLVRVEADISLHAQGTEPLQAFRLKTAAELQKVLGVRTKVEIAESGSIPRTDFKARRVIDDRDLFSTLSAKLVT